jgi:hypothetical protein
MAAASQRPGPHGVKRPGVFFTFASRSSGALRLWIRGPGCRSHAHAHADEAATMRAGPGNGIKWRSLSVSILGGQGAGHSCQIAVTIGLALALSTRLVTIFVRIDVRILHRLGNGRRAFNVVSVRTGNDMVAWRLQRSSMAAPKATISKCTWQVRTCRYSCHEQCQ